VTAETRTESQTHPGVAPIRRALSGVTIIIMLLVFMCKFAAASEHTAPTRACRIDDKYIAGLSLGPSADVGSRLLSVWAQMAA
jgi:hypothetical protein